MRFADQSGDGNAAGPPQPLIPDLDSAVRAARDGDEDAFRLLFRAVQPSLLRYLRVLVGGDGCDAEDIASETWLQITRDLRTFQGDEDGFRGWAATIARHRAMDYLRAKRRRPTADLPVETLGELPARDDTEGAVLATAATREALAMIAALPRDQAEAVLLRVVMQLDAQSAARVLGKRAGTVRMATHRGLRRLAGLLDAPAAPPTQDEVRDAPKKSSREGVTQPGPSTLKDMR
ncbi:RNA polymerase sigma factor [Kitasatospora nipponensis]|uniref:RNA polymerase sigma factor n=1 Tax=Kitasatospora nipponensis TaxID=258049 RepID=A0ABP4GR71_9ACTN